MSAPDGAGCTGARFLTIERLAAFCSSIDATGGPDACWPWLGTLNQSGYGVFGLDGSTKLAHRLAYELTVGPIPPGGPPPQGWCVCHTCDNRVCQNPAHLWLGSNADNHRDKVAKGRQNTGEKNGRAKLCEFTARLILSSELSYKDLADLFGVSTTAITWVRKGTNWPHVWAEHPVATAPRRTGDRYRDAALARWARRRTEQAARVATTDP